jgi:hypothetical protein
MATPDQIAKRLSKLQSILLKSGLQQKDQPLYQVINQLIQAVSEAVSSLVVDIEESGGGGSAGGDETFLTVADELATLPNSSQLIAGDHLSFDTSTPNQLRADVLLGGGTFLTVDDESADLPNSRQELPGTFITFDDSVPNQRTINGTGETLYYDAPLSDGDPIAAELIFADGECIIVQVPNP